MLNCNVPFSFKDENIFLSLYLTSTIKQENDRKPTFFNTDIFGEVLDSIDTCTDGQNEGVVKNADAKATSAGHVYMLTCVESKLNNKVSPNCVFDGLVWTV